MSLQDLSAVELAQLLQNLVTLLGGTELSAIDSHVRADLVTAIGTLPNDIITADGEVDVAKGKWSAAVAKRDGLIGQGLKQGRSGRDFLTAGNAPKEQFELAGFDFPDTTRSTYVAQTPSDLAVVGFSNGVNEGKFKGNNKSGSVTYQIFRRQGDDGDWMMVDSVPAPKFTDEGITPGQYYEYRVRAKASKNTSQWSNSAVVYGMVKP